MLYGPAAHALYPTASSAAPSPIRPTPHPDARAAPAAALKKTRPNQPRRASFLRRTAAVHATFLVSALVHEYIAWVVDTR